MAGITRLKLFDGLRDLGLRNGDVVMMHSSLSALGFVDGGAETVRRREGSLRSCHPTHSWVALGPAAERLLTGQKDCLTFCGRSSPFEPLVELDGCVLTLGVQVDTITMWHYYEEVAQRSLSWSLLAKGKTHQ